MRLFEIAIVPILKNHLKVGSRETLHVGWGENFHIRKLHDLTYGGAFHVLRIQGIGNLAANGTPPALNASITTHFIGAHRPNRSNSDKVIHYILQNLP